MEIGASPTPRTETMTNCPGLMAQRFFQLESEIPVLGGHVDNFDNPARLRQEGVPGKSRYMG